MKMTLNQTRLGILGGGQLARMLAIEAHLMGLSVSVFCQTPSDPAAQVVRNFVKGNIKNLKSVQKFVSSQDFVTFESEFIPAKVLKELCHTPVKTSIFPAPELMLELQDRKSQKNWFDKNNLPTSNWIHPQSMQDIDQFSADFGWPVICKSRYGGYDGYGTLVVKNSAQLKKLSSTTDWTDYICESFIHFRRELAIQFVRNKDGQFQKFPLVETFQQKSRCLWVKGPILDKPSIKQLLPIQSKIKKAMAASNYCGILAVELFQCQGKLLINEIAPRVHNSAHYTQDALLINQFGMHLRAGLNLKLEKIENKHSGFAMVNILGKSNKLGAIASTSDCKFHWYGKLENRPGRKMGHINCTSTTANSALKQALKTRQEISV